MRTNLTTFSGLATLLAFVSVVGESSTARAEDGCSLRGDAVMAKGVAIYDAPSGGNEIATFTGGSVGLNVTRFPETMGGRAQVTTTGFRITGYVRSKDFPVYTSRTVPVYAGHVFIAPGRKVSVMGANGGKLHVEKTATFPMSGYFHGWAPCEAFSFTQGPTPGFTPDGDARGYVVKKERAELFAEPRGDVVTSIEPSGDGVLLWSTERSGAWIHVEHHGEIILDGWIKAQDVSALPPGETMDQQSPGTSVPGSPKLQIQGNLKTITVSREVSLRAKAGEASAPIGAIESGVEVMVVDIVAGWANVLPKSLSMMPSGGGFWARVKDLGL